MIISPSHAVLMVMWKLMLAPWAALWMFSMISDQSGSVWAVGLWLA